MCHNEGVNQLPLIEVEELFMANLKKLDLSERIIIQKGLDERMSVTAIALEIGRNISTVTREITKHISFKNSYGFGGSLNRCAFRSECIKHDLCAGMSHLCRKKRCSSCRKTNCNQSCPDFQVMKCAKLEHPPYVCNGCSSKSKCNLVKSLYIAENANHEALILRSESRSGIALSEEVIREFDQLISPRILNGQSVHQIFASSPGEFTICERSAYRLINANLISARPIDMPRTVQRKLRVKSKHVKVDKKCRIGRTYDDFKRYMADHNDESILQGDTVEGKKGGKCILTLTWVDWNFQIGFLRDHNNSSSVTDCVNLLYESLGVDLFSKVVPKVWLLDNGTEFSNPSEIEKYGIHVFYCDPGRPDQKGACENTHEHIRRILPQGTSFDDIDQDFLNLLFSHTNAFKRKKLNDHSPYEMFNLLFGADINIQEALHIAYVDPKDVILTPKLLCMYRSSLQSSEQEVSN